MYKSVCRAASRELTRGTMPPAVYQTLHGKGGLVHVDGRFATLATPDASGFRGFTCPGELTAFGPEDGILDGMFPADGQPARFRTMVAGVGGWAEQDC